MTEPHSAKGGAESKRGLLCVKCEHLNLATDTLCQICGADLFMICLQCGSRNERVRSRCTQCRQSLSYTWWRRFLSRWTGRKNSAMVLVQALFLHVGGMSFGIACEGVSFVL
jgi:hypothetical protein